MCCCFQTQDEQNFSLSTFDLFSMFYCKSFIVFLRLQIIDLCSYSHFTPFENRVWFSFLIISFGLSNWKLTLECTHLREEYFMIIVIIFKCESWPLCFIGLEERKMINWVEVQNVVTVFVHLETKEFEYLFFTPLKQASRIKYNCF